MMAAMGVEMQKQNGRNEKRVMAYFFARRIPLPYPPLFIT